MANYIDCILVLRVYQVTNHTLGHFGWPLCPATLIDYFICLVALFKLLYAHGGPYYSFWCALSINFILKYMNLPQVNRPWKKIENLSIGCGQGCENCCGGGGLRNCWEISFPQLDAYLFLSLIQPINLSNSSILSFIQVCLFLIVKVYLNSKV